MLKTRYVIGRTSSLSLAKRSVTQNTRILNVSKLPSLKNRLEDRYSDPFLNMVASTPAKTKLDIIPLSDFRIGSTSLLKIDSFRNLAPMVISEIPPLPDVEAPSFSAIFSEKIRACQKICPFADEIKEKQSIERKTQNLTEIHRLFIGSSPESCSLTDEQFESIYNMLIKNIVRRIPTLMPLILGNDDVSPLEEPAWTHLSIVYQILFRVLVEYANAPFINEKTVKDILSVAHSYDARERTQISNFIPKIVSFRPDLINTTIKEFTDLINEYSDGAFPPYLICTITQAFIGMIKSSDEITPTFTLFFRRSIVPLIGDRFYPLFEANLFKIIEYFVDDDSRNAHPIVFTMLKYWPITKASKQASFLTVLTRCVPKLPSREIANISKRVFSVFANAADSDASKVAEASFAMWTAIGFERIIQENTKLAVSVFLPHVLRAKRGHWSQPVREGAAYALQTLVKLDPRGVQAAAQKEKEADNKELRGWVIVARTAAALDSSIDLSKTLLTVTTAFAEMQPQLQSVGQNTRQRQLLGSSGKRTSGI